MKKQMRRIIPVLAVFLVSFSMLNGQEKKSEQKIKL